MRAAEDLRVMVVEDQELVRVGFKVILQQAACASPRPQTGTRRWLSSAGRLRRPGPRWC
jgi:hypothetical protein